MTLEERFRAIENKKPVVALGVAALCVLLAWILLFRPALDGLKKINAQKNSYQKREQVYRAVLDLETQFQAQEKKLKPEKGKSWLLEELNSMAEASNLTILSISPEDRPNVQKEFQAMSFRVEAEGVYHDMGAFVSRIESMPYLINIGRAEISEQTDSLFVSTDAAGRLAGGKKYKIILSVNLLYPRKSAIPS